THTSAGATTVSQGAMIINGSMGNTQVGVAGGAALGGNGSIGGSVSVTGGSTAAAQGAIDLRDGLVGALKLTDANTLDTALIVGGNTSGNPGLLDFDVGLAADSIGVNAAKLLIDNGGGIVNISPLSGFGPGTYNLITFATGQASGLNRLTLSTGNLPGTFTYQLQTTSTAEQLVVTPEPSSVVLLTLGAAGVSLS